MSLMSRSRLIWDSTRSPSVAGDHHQQPQRQADPPPACRASRKCAASVTAGHPEQQRPGQALPGLLRADRRHHRVLTEKHADGIPGDIGAHHADHKAEHPARSRAAEKPAAQRRPNNGTQAASKTVADDVAQIVDRGSSAVRRGWCRARRQNMQTTRFRQTPASAPAGSYGQVNQTMSLTAEQQRYDRHVVTGLRAAAGPPHGSRAGMATARRNTQHCSGPTSGSLRLKPGQQHADHDRRRQIAASTRLLGQRSWLPRLVGRGVCGGISLCHGRRLLSGR